MYLHFYYILYIFIFCMYFMCFYHRVSSKNEIKQRAGGFVLWTKESSKASFENLAHDTLNL